MKALKKTKLEAVPDPSPQYDTKKVDQMVLALLQLTSYRDRKDGPVRAWKGHDWEVLNRLHKQGFISDPVGKAKSVQLTDSGVKKSVGLFRKFFGKE